MAFRMTEATFNEKYWSYYLSLEKDVFDFSAYVPIHPDNMQTFSPCYRKMLILIAMEFENVSKEICNELGLSHKDMGDYKEMLLYFGKTKNSGISPLCFQTVNLFNYYPIKRCPFEVLKEEKPNNTPIFWKVYNNTKHCRSNGSNNKVNLNTVIDAICALYIVERLLILINTTEMGSLSIPGEFHQRHFLSQHLYIEAFDDFKKLIGQQAFFELQKRAETCVRKGVRATNV